MSAPACSCRWLAPIAALALSGSLYAGAQVPRAPQISKPAAPVVKRGEPAPPLQSADGRYGIQVLASIVNVHAEAPSGSPALAQLQQGARLEADQRRGNWYRIRLADGRSGWIDYAVGKSNPNFAVDAGTSIARGRPGSEAGAPPAPVDVQPEAASAPGPEALPDDRILLQRPMGRPLEAIIPAIDPSQVPPPSPLLPRETVPVPDRWRIA